MQAASPKVMKQLIVNIVYDPSTRALLPINYDASIETHVQIV
jgi:hypothetical protein